MHQKASWESVRRSSVMQSVDMWYFRDLYSAGKYFSKAATWEEMRSEPFLHPNEGRWISSLLQS